MDAGLDKKSVSKFYGEKEESEAGSSGAPDPPGLKSAGSSRKWEELRDRNAPIDILYEQNYYLIQNAYRRILCLKRTAFFCPTPSTCFYYR